MLVDRWKSLGVTNKEVALKLANDFRNEWEADQAGLLPPKPMRDGAKIPLISVSKVKERGKEVRKRRAFSDEEFAQLIDVSDPNRGTVYLTAGRTGLRRQELAALQWQDIILNPEKPYILARAATTKNEKEGFIPLVPDLYKHLLAFKPSDAKPVDLVFTNGIPRARDMRKDLERAGIA
ncbi:MAG: hypothetical protein AAGA45_00935 [Verrucomicrobiota bacterium]